jgi:hypothetical protein
MKDAGKLKLYDLVNTAAEGDAPVEKLLFMGEEFYSEKTVGYNRIYAAMGANEKIDKVVRCFNTDLPNANAVKYAILEDGKQYQITVKQMIVDEDCTDLTLVRVEDYFDVVSE